MTYYSQYGQDEYIIQRLKNKRYGFFVDLGAALPIELSNTYYIERELNWNGILIEAGAHFIENLQQQRTSTVVHALIFNKPDIEVSYMIDNGVGLGNHIKGFGVAHAIVSFGIKARTTTLQTVLDENNAPNIIDYLSLDIEGAELQALQSVDLNKYQFRIMTIEENGQQSSILQFLEPYGYVLDTILQNPGLNEKELVIVHKDLINE